QEQAAAADPAKPVHQRAADRPAQSPRTYLAVPYADKDQAKAAGAKWDRTQKAWYAPEGADMAAFAHWAPSREPAVQASPEAEFGQALQRAGLVIDGAPIMDGKMHRVPAQGDTAGEKSGAYVGYLDGHPAGYIQNFKSDIKENWKYSGRSEELTATDRARLEAEAAEKLATRQAERDQRYREVSQAVGAEYAAAVAAASDHPYLREKGVGAHDLKVDANGKLLLSMRDVDGTLWSVQRIDVDGTKSFEKDGRKAGTFHLIGDLEAAGKNGKPQPIGIAEGYATAATVHEATGVPVAVAFDAYNLSAVAAEIAAKFPDRPVVIFGDDDRHRADEGKVNVGRDRALEAAREIGAQAVFPQFAEGQKGSQYSDFNDLAKAQGKSSAHKQIRQSLASAVRRENAASNGAERAARRAYATEQRQRMDDTAADDRRVEAKEVREATEQKSATADPRVQRKLKELEKQQGKRESATQKADKSKSRARDRKAVGVEM
ncbi:DUF5710 domain-containing protein, partial [Xanthomonas phaseoli]